MVRLLLILSISLLAAGCAGPGAASSGGNTILIDNPEIGLDIYIGRLSGVRVSGSGAGATISIRGGDNTTIQGDPRPLFVVDGMQMGRDFSSVYNNVNMHRVYSISVLYMSRATVRYGHEGRNGVIEITMSG